ncbi:MAG: hypothetical protein JO107_05160 [Hyphomicrobiales bacterium]|nr:hypothetical protein [Hyphomicrobiales bacterium]MBV8662470.1 hypothetical protein [Hyphomicrobiales bacterium]
MVTLPADEDYAKAMLSIFIDKGVRAGQTLKADQVGVEFAKRNMGRPADYQAALHYAAFRGWLRLELGRLRLTEQGCAEM